MAKQNREGKPKQVYLSDAQLADLEGLLARLPYWRQSDALRAAVDLLLAHYGVRPRPELPLMPPQPKKGGGK